MLKLYGHPYSHNARKVHYLLEEIGASYEYVTVDLMTGAQKKPEFVRLNPLGRVPVIDHDGFVMYESNAILAYLGEQLASGSLWPADARERGHVLMWLSWQASDLGPAVFKPWMLGFMASLGQPLDTAQHQALVSAAPSTLQVLEAQLESRSWVVGDRFSVADIALAESVGLCADAGISLDAFPRLRDWHSRYAERPAFARTRPAS